MKLAFACLALLCLGAVVAADNEAAAAPETKTINLQLPKLELPKLELPKLPELKLPKLELPKLQAQEGKLPKLQMPGNGRLRMGQLNLTMPNITGIELPRLPGGLSNQALKTLQNITNSLTTDQLKAAAILAWLKDAGFYQLKNITEQGGKVVIDLARHAHEKPAAAQADAAAPKAEAPKAEAPKAAEDTPATSAASHQRTGGNANKNGQQQNTPKPAAQQAKPAQKPATTKKPVAAGAHKAAAPKKN